MRLTGRLVVTPDGVIEDGAIEIDGAGTITVVERARVHEEIVDRLLTPGLVDIQNNGDAGVSCAIADGEDWSTLDAALLGAGVTTWFPTLVTAPLDSYGPALARIERARTRETVAPVPTIAGVHLEGPFLGGAPGAHDPGLIRAADAEWLATLPRLVRIVTVAPEAEGAVAAIEALTARGVVVALGHSTATAEQATAAIEAGATLVTHLYNGMAPFHHRSPGLLGVALTDDRVTASLIADLVHVDEIGIRLAFAAKAAGGVALVSDTVAGATQRPDGTLAGGTARLGRCVANAVHTGIDLGDAVAAASTVPARLLGLHDRGALSPGRRADVVALHPGSLDVESVWIGGGLAWERQG